MATKENTDIILKQVVDYLSTKGVTIPIIDLKSNINIPHIKKLHKFVVKPKKKKKKKLIINKKKKKNNKKIKKK